MSLVPVIVTLSVLWLAWRAVQLWTLPLTVVLRHLNIEIPAVPHLTIDSLTADSVSLHWLPPESHVKKHIIQMDGQEVGISQKGETSVTISGLTPDYLYSVQVIAVNAQGFQMASPAIYLRTRPKEDSTESSTEGPHEPHIQTFPQTEVSLGHRAPRKKNSLDVKSKEMSQSAAISIDTKHIEPAHTIEVLTLKMENISKETAETETQLAQLQENHLQEEANYAAKLEDLRAKKREEDDARAAKDQLHKQLDQQKREIETKRNQIQRALKADLDEYRKQTTDIASFRSSAKNSIETAEHLQESLKTLKSDTDEAVQEMVRAGAIAAEELSEIESEIRYLLSRKAESETELARLMSASRQPSPSPEEVSEAAQAEAAWKGREDSLIRQYEELQHNLLQLQGGNYAALDRGLGTPNSDPGMDHSHVHMRRKVSKRGKPEDLNRSDLHRRSTGVPTFNPDAAPFVASGPLYTNNENTIHHRAPTPQQNYTNTEQYYAQLSYPLQTDNSATPRSVFPALPAYGTTSIFGGSGGGGETSVSSVMPAFPRRESPISSQSGSNPPSPAVQNRVPLPSIFNKAPSIHARNSGGSLVDRLNGTPLTDATELPVKASTDGSKWFWPTRKTQADPLALDRKNTRSLPKVDVAPIGTKRNRSGSLREEAPTLRASPGPTSNGYPDVDLLNVLGHPLSRETSVEKDAYSTSAFPLPRPSNGRAFGWEPQVPSSQRHLPNPWSSIESENNTASTQRPFDPFGDLEATNGTTFPTVKEDIETQYHTTIDSSRLSFLHREQSNGSRKSGRSKAESHESKEKPRRMGDKKFSSFVGRVFGKREDKDEKDFKTEDEEEGEAIVQGIL
ncbi:protein of unknown function [Taphrina deformans PYCC 5710]|uniref:Fibronectin type-III domain-containing protein n=1 Tax=Taphrina deformans (strain PYCC 5710 / ATCC 11124 / CBS 356.35 / IMI 108563 / JCM 9778 / NBRC 8474) TaxID=1097556 RepID=R4XEY3_TAPDE|nr:protein of unknown function [Taphrina deformans PYCC 5710]|eukprot:CCG84188.1 protein of unknown function [Taphrina deformans PYCC 5710]